jgi:hypothetical protein
MNEQLERCKFALSWSKTFVATIELVADVPIVEESLRL